MRREAWPAKTAALLFVASCRVKRGLVCERDVDWLRGKAEGGELRG